jgi:hypothetical protein
MKKLMEKAIVIIATVLISNPMLGQSPFGTPPSGNNQAPTPDRLITTSFSVPSEPGGSGSPGICNKEIIHTGNDIQIMEHNGSSLTVKAMVWDGCPEFFFEVSGGPYSTGASTVVPLDGGSNIEDPDIVLSQNIGSNVYITIVYKSGKFIKYEEWRYNHAQPLLYNVTPSSPLSSGNSTDVVKSPNIDGNAQNEYVITYELNKQIIAHTAVNHPIDPLTDMSDQINLTDCYIDVGFVTPDVSISDGGSNTSIASFAVIQENGPYNDLIVMQESFSVLNALSTPTSHCLNRIPLEIESNCKNPRISSPDAAMINHTYECAVTTEYRFNDINGSVFGIKLYDNYYNPGPLSSFDRRLLNYQIGIANFVPYTGNELPAISYAAPGKVSVAWTYRNQVDEEGNDYKKDVISVNYNLNSNIRTPNSYEYFMLVNQTRDDDQYAASVAAETNYGGSNRPTFYGYAGIYSGVYRPAIKTSNTSLHPQIRKKSILTDGVNEVEEVLIYPNPTTQYVNIDFKGIDEKESIRLRIFSLDGRIVYDKTTSTSGFSQAIDLTSFEKGVYLLEYEYSDVIEREKVIVQ